MKILVIPDIHGEFSYAQDNFDNYFDIADKIVFLGDYVDPYNKELNNLQLLTNGINWVLDCVDNYPDKVIALIGNHDYSYITEFKTNRYTPNFRNEFYNIFKDNIINGKFQLCAMFDGVLFSHAGVSTSWLDYLDKEYGIDLTSTSDIVLSLNNLFAHYTAINAQTYSPFEYNPLDDSMYGNNEYQSPLWIRPRALIQGNPFIKKQVIGHTKQHTCPVKISIPNGFIACIDSEDNSKPVLFNTEN